MILLKKQTIELTDKGTDLLLHLYHDTYHRSLRPAGKIFFQGFQLIGKSWIGYVDLNERDFSILRIRSLSKRNISSVIVRGYEAKTPSGVHIEMRYNLSWTGLISFMSLLTVLILITSVLSLDVWSWIIGVSFFILYSLYILLDLNRTEEKIMEYVEKYCG